MAKIEKWDKRSDGRLLEWENSDAPLIMQVQQIGESGDWVAELTGPSSNDDYLVGEFDTKKAARQAAVEWMKDHPLVKDVKIEKSELFHDFHNRCRERMSGTDPYVIEVWPNRDEVRGKYQDRHAHYPGDGPIAQIGWRDLSDATELQEYHCTRREAASRQAEVMSVETDEVEEEIIETELHEVNGDVLQELWMQRKDRIEINKQDLDIVDQDYVEYPKYLFVSFEWVDDATWKSFLEEKGML